MGANPGDNQGVVVVFRDVSDHRRPEIELREEAATDELTGLANRRYFISELERRYGSLTAVERDKVAIMMLDLDRFKAINDTYGHAVGDEVLKHLAITIRDVLRKCDLVGRIGGEEFAIMQVGASKSDAMRLAQRLREQIEEGVVQTAAGKLRYTASVGVTLLSPADVTAVAALPRADLALYQAKALGRNRVEWEPPALLAEPGTDKLSDGSGDRASTRTGGEPTH